MRAKSLQSCPALFDPMDCHLPGFSVQGILQARMLEWAVMPSSRGSSGTQGSNPRLMSLVLASGFFITKATWEALSKNLI